ncbi:MAG: PD-(D/E)XK nuclease family protein [Paludibacteraceae bacterium]|nr:PD-(D/E)XK nuclease family protein [Paludibacteraceae bacterium]
MTEKNIEDIPNKAGKAHDYYKKLIEKRSADINLIDLLHCNENAHSRILKALLDYNKESFRKSFAQRTGLPKDFDLKDANIYLEYPAKEGRIDIYIYKENEYAIIIENKINGAQEQHEQIDRYVETALEKYDKDKIFCLYLTREGGYPSENSLKEKAATLNFKREEPYNTESRLIQINYKVDILNWLKDDVLPNIPYKDKSLIDGINHYIDFLNNMFNLNNSSITEMSDVLKKLNISQDEKSLLEWLEKVESLKKALYGTLTNKLKNISLNIVDFRLDNENNFELGLRKASDTSKDGYILIYRQDDGKYSLGWTNNYLKLKPTSENRTNKYNCPHKLYTSWNDLFHDLQEENNK